MSFCVAIFHSTICDHALCATVSKQWSDEDFTKHDVSDLKDLATPARLNLVGEGENKVIKPGIYDKNFYNIEKTKYPWNKE